MTGQIYNPTGIRWCSLQNLKGMLPVPTQRILIIAAGSSQKRAEQLCSGSLACYDVEVLSNVPADPTAATVQNVVDFVKKRSPDWIVAIGGGSVLDTAKAAALIANHQNDVLAFLRGHSQVNAPGIPLIAVPTTGGSGSEVTPYASITDTRNMRKISLAHDYLYPKYAVLDPSLCLTLTRRQTAVSGMDALSHAIEGYWSNQSTPVSDSHALAAIRLMMTMLPEAYRNGGDLHARHMIMEGSLFAGLTISNAKTTAVHAVSYPMTVFFHIPHGLACSLVLPSFIRFNAESMRRDKEQHLLDSLNLTSMNQLAEAVEALQEQLGLPVRLRDLGLGITDIATIVDNGFRPDRMNNNPRDVTPAVLRRLLEEIL